MILQTTTALLEEFVKVFPPTGRSFLPQTQQQATFASGVYRLLLHLLTRDESDGALIFCMDTTKAAMKTLGEEAQRNKT